MAHPSYDNKNMRALSASTEGALVSDTPLAATPIGYVRVFLDTFAVPIADGAKTGWAYWSNDDGATAAAFAELDTTSKLYWLPSNAGRTLGGYETLEFDFLVAD
jgi:hypothetical protein